MRILFIGGYGHHYLLHAVDQGRAEAVGWAAGVNDLQAARKKSGNRLPEAAPFYEDYREAIDQLQPDAVNIGTTYAHNGRIVLDALQRGVTILADKPIAATWPHLEAIEQHAADHPGTILLTEFNLRSEPPFVAARRAVEQQRIGSPVLVTAQKSYRWGSRPEFYKRREDYGGTLLWIASHAVDLAWFVTGCDLRRVAGRAANVSRPDFGDCEDHVALCYEIAGGGSALVHADFLRPPGAPSHGDDRIRVAGSHGLIEVRDGACTLMTGDAPPTDVTDLGRDARLTDNLLDALAGRADVYSTRHSLTMARWLLTSRDAADQQTCLTL